MSLIFHRSDGEIFEYDGTNLYHFGIKGMKWGVRRFQNEDGSLTPAGKARYQKLSDMYSAVQRKREKNDAYIDRLARGNSTKNLSRINKAMSQSAKLTKKANKLKKKLDKMPRETDESVIKIGGYAIPNKNKRRLNDNMRRELVDAADRLDSDPRIKQYMAKVDKKLSSVKRTDPKAYEMEMDGERDYIWNKLMEQEVERVYSRYNS